MNTDDLLFDTGILKNVLRNQQHDENLNQTLDRLGFTGKTPYVIATPLMLLEVLSLSGENFNPFSADSENELGVRKILSGATAEEMDAKFPIAFKYIEEKIQADPRFTLAALREKFNFERNFHKRSPLSQHLLDMCFSQNLTESKYASFVSRYAFDIFQGLPLEKYGLDKNAATRLDSYIFSTIFFSIKDHTNFACCRYADRIYMRLGKLKNQAMPELFAPGTQMVDTEATHFVLTGNRREESTYTVSFITTENLDGWKARLAQYLTVVQFANECGQGRFGPIELRPGYIHSVSPSGLLTGKFMDVKKEFGLS